MAAYKSRGQGRGRMGTAAARKKASTSRRRNTGPKKTRGQGRGYMTDPAKRRQASTMKKAGKAAAKRTPKGRGGTVPKKDTRTRGGQGGARGANDQMAFQRFVSMTPEQQRHVMRMAPGEHRRRTR